MAEFNYYLKSQSSDKETPINLYVRYKLAHKTETVKVSTGERILPSRWNSSTKKPRKFEGSPELDTRLTHISGLAQNVLRKYLNDNEGNLPTATKLKTLLVEVLRPDQVSKDSVGPLSFFELFDVIVKERKTGINPKRGKNYSSGSMHEVRISRDKIKEFVKSKRIKAFGFEDVTLNFYYDFMKFLKRKNYSTNYVGKMIKVLKMVMNEGLERKLHANLDFKLKRFVKPTEETPQIYLNVEELQRFENVDLSNNPRLDRVRDLLILGAWTGLRFGDFTTISKHNIHLDTSDGDYIEKKTEKTGHTVVIPIFEPVRRIIDKYDGRTVNSLPRIISNQRFNDYIKELGELIGLDEPIETGITKGGMHVAKMLPKHQGLSSHICRRSFATNAFKMGVPTITIREITGHNTEVAFLRYIRATPKEHANKMREIMTRKLNPPIKKVG
jgi:integrase